MSSAEIQSLVLSALQGLGISTIFLLCVFIGFCVLVGLTKHRAIGKDSLVDRLGPGARYLSPAVPRGPADQLKTPELLEQSGPHS